MGQFKIKKIRFSNFKRFGEETEISLGMILLSSEGRMALEKQHYLMP